MVSKERIKRKGGWYFLVSVCLLVGSQWLFPASSNGEHPVSIYVSPLRTVENSQPGVILEADSLVISRDQLEKTNQSISIKVLSTPVDLMGEFKVATDKGEKYFTLEQLKNGQKFALEKDVIVTPKLFFSGEKMTNDQQLQVASLTYEISFLNGSAEVIVNGDKKSGQLPRTNNEEKKKNRWLGYCVLFSVTGIQFFRAERQLVD